MKMRTPVSILILFLALAITLTAAGSASAASQKGKEGSASSTITVDKKIYPMGQPVTIKLEVGEDESLVLSNSAPWAIYKQSAPDSEPVFSPAATQAIVELKAKETRTWTWDQKDTGSNQVKPGTYSVTLKTSSGDLTTKFTITGLRHEKSIKKGEPTLPDIRPFKDVKGDVSWGDPHVLRLYEKGIVQGMNHDEFDPDGTLTRAQFLTMLLRASGAEPDEGYSPEEDPFPDVTPAHWAHKNIARAMEMGVVLEDEYPSGFQPDAPINRLEICVMAVRCLGRDGEAAQSSGDDLAFRDMEQVSLKYRGYVKVGVDWDIVRGYDDGTFRPEAHATRREACVIVYRTMGDS